MEEPTFCKERDIISKPKPNAKAIEREEFDLNKLLRDVGMQDETDEEGEEFEALEEENEEGLGVEDMEKGEEDEQITHHREDVSIHKDGFHLAPYTNDLEYGVSVIFAEILF